MRAILIAATALVAAFPASAPAAKKKVTCTKRTGDTIYRDQTLRAFQTVKRSKADPDAATVTIKTCEPGRSAKPKTLAKFKNTLDGSLTVLSAMRGGHRHLALSLSEETGTVDAVDLFVYNLTTRRRTFAYSSESRHASVVTIDGGVAILETESGTITGFDGAGERVLGTTASGLAVAGLTVYWTSAGVAQSATLTGEASRDL